MDGTGENGVNAFCVLEKVWVDRFWVSATGQKKGGNGVDPSGC
jgi:hypothetical protein